MLGSLDEGEDAAVQATNDSLTAVTNGTVTSMTDVDDIEVNANAKLQDKNHMEYINNNAHANDIESIDEVLPIKIFLESVNVVDSLVPSMNFVSANIANNLSAEEVHEVNFHNPVVPKAPCGSMVLTRGCDTQHWHAESMHIRLSEDEAPVEADAVMAVTEVDGTGVPPNSYRAASYTYFLHGSGAHGDGALTSDVGIIDRRPDHRNSCTSPGGDRWQQWHQHT